MNTKSFLKGIMFLFLISTLASCVTIREGEVGVKSTFGKFSEKPMTRGLKAYNPFVSRVIKISTQTENLEVGLNIPSKEGLTIMSEVSILYNIDGKKVTKLLRDIGPDYERNVILPVFRSAVADVTSRFYAKDMHTGERATIEKAIRDQMMVLMDGKGIEVEAVLLRASNYLRAWHEQLKQNYRQNKKRSKWSLSYSENNGRQSKKELKLQVSEMHS